MQRGTIDRRGFVGGFAALAWGGWPRGIAAMPARAQDQARLTGDILWPGAPGFEEARWDFNSRFSRVPAAIVNCGSAADVQNAILWSQRRQMPLRARSGGHSYEAYSILDDGLVIDVGGLNGISVDAASRQAVVGAGVRLGDLAQRLWAEGLALPAGTCPTVGIAGLTLGGGIGFLSRQYGLTCDSLLAVDLADANGDLLRASADENSDLFWALRGGGGGNFGIATAFTFQLYPVDRVVVFYLTWPWDDAAEVIAAWQRWAPTTDTRLTSGLVVPAPSAGSVNVAGLFTGAAGQLTPLLMPLLHTGVPGAPRIESLTYGEATARFAGQPVAHSTFKNASAFVAEPLSAGAIDTLLAQMRAAPAGSNLVGFFATGGAVAAIAPEETAYVHRDALFDMQYQSYWTDPAAEEASVAWIGAIRDAMQPHTSGAYVNYIDADLPDWATAYYGDNLRRLREVKSTYDPDDIFNGPQSIPG